MRERPAKSKFDDALRAMNEEAAAPVVEEPPSPAPPPLAEPRKGGRPPGKKSSGHHVQTAPQVPAWIYHAITAHLTKNRLMKTGFRDYGELVTYLLERYLDEQGIDAEELRQEWFGE